MEISDLQTQGFISSCAENYHATDNRVDRLIEPTRKSWTGTCYARRIITAPKSIVIVPENREYLRTFVISQIVTYVEQ